MKEPDLDFVKQPYSALVSKDFRGVRISSSGPAENQKSFENLRISVTYIVDEIFLTEQQVELPLKSMILVCICQDSLLARNLTQDLAIFEDDFTRRDGCIFGFLNFNLASYHKYNGTRDLYVTLALGTFLSNTLRIKGQGKVR